MKKALFEELTESIREAGSIRRGERQPSRTFEFTPDDVRSIRERLHKSQSEFARMIGVTVPTLQNWEQGRRKPQGPARALLVVASREPQLVASALASAVQKTGRRKADGTPRGRGAKMAANGAARRSTRAKA
jgi:putative transcriptional regulator